MAKRLECECGNIKNFYLLEIREYNAMPNCEVDYKRPNYHEKIFKCDKCGQGVIPVKPDRKEK